MHGVADAGRSCPAFRVTSAKHPPQPLHIPYEALESAADWFAQLRADQSDAATHAAWQRWLDASEHHRQAWRYVDLVSASFQSMRQPDNAAIGEAALQSLRVARVSRRRALGAIGLLGGSGLLTWASWKASPLPYLAAYWMADFRTATGETRTVQLADGSQVWLNTDSAIDTAYTPHERLLRLTRGEILIQTSGQADQAGLRPFRVATREGRIDALGTRFDVRQFDAITRVAVFEGAVAIQPAAGGTRRLLHAGEAASFDRVAIGATHAADSAQEAWHQGVLLAENMSLGEWVDELGRYRRGHLSVDPAVSDLRVLGSFPTADTDLALTLLEQALPVRVHRRFGWWTTIGPRPVT